MHFRHFSTNPLLYAILIVFISLPGATIAQTQGKAVVETNYRVSLKRSETDFSESNTTHLNLVMPAGEFSGFGLNYDILDSSRFDASSVETELDLETNGYGISYFLRDSSLGRIGYQTLRLDLEQDTPNPIPDTEPTYITDKRDLDVETVYAELYMANTTIAYYKINNEYENQGKLKQKKWQVGWYFNESVKVSYYSSKAEVSNSSNENKINGIDISYQPGFAKNYASITLGYSRDKDNDELDQISLALDFYFKSPVGLKTRDRLFQ